jgi:hypothetical protein
MLYPLYEDALGDARNVRAMAAASELAYLAEPDAAGPFQSQLGMTARLISVGNSQAYVATNPEHVLVAFRGTEALTSIEGLKDWLLTDALNLLMVPEGRLGTDLAAAGVGARFHQGFVNAIADIWEPVHQEVDRELRKADRPLWLTGHSLGGALALLAGWLFHRRMISVHQIYTFGGPMIGNTEAARAIDREFRGRIFRFVNGPDPVPQLPLMSLIANEYCHCDQKMSLAADPDPAADPTLLQQTAAQVGNAVLNSTAIDEIWASVHQRIAAHFMANYRQLIERLPV